MDYYKILNFDKEPFSNSPDPEFFYRSKQHVKCLQNIELSLRLRRGLNAVIGDVGTGKSTLCRQLLLNFSKEKEFYETHLILDPGFKRPMEFLLAIMNMFGEKIAYGIVLTEWQLKERIKKYLFRRCVNEKKTVVLIIDEGQKIPDFCLEILREFLNYETNEYKLLQVVIFGQKEFDERLRAHANLLDRINCYYSLEPLDFRETRAMINYRLAKASSDLCKNSLFKFSGLWAIYLSTNGYPRKIVNLCNRVMLNLIIQNQTKAGCYMVFPIARKVFPFKIKRWRKDLAYISAAFMIFMLGFAPDLLATRKNIEAPITPAIHAEEMAIPASSSSVLKGSSSLDQWKTNPGTADALETESETVLEKASGTLGIPELLGQLTIEKPGDSVGKLVSRVYGEYDYNTLRAVANANPLIDNIDIVEIGQTLNFPAIPVEGNPFPSDAYVVELAQKESLEEAYRYTNNYSDKQIPIRIIPHWNDKSGLKFSILLKQKFNSESSALNGLTSLSAEYVSEAKVVHNKHPNAIFFGRLNL